MATLLKIRGLDRGTASGDSPVVARRGFRVPSALGKQFLSGVKASLTPTANTQTYTAKYGGTWGNSVRIQTATGTLAVSVSYAASTGVPTILVTAPATATLAANTAVVNAVNAHAEASQLVTASIAGTGAAAHAVVAATALSGGTDVGTGQSIYVRTNQSATALVDADDPATAKMLRRNAGRFISLGQP
jgi:hypothetical protein